LRRNRRVLQVKRPFRARNRSFNGALSHLNEQTIDAVSIEETDHYRLMREFCADPQNFVESVLTDQ
jgi:hypothetical protein